MKKFHFFALAPVLCVTLLALTACSGQNMPTAPSSPVSQDSNLSQPIVPSTRTVTKFDSFGYNDQANIFNGLADGVDGTLDGLYFGGVAFAKDHLVMKWNDEWTRGVSEGWSDPEGYDAHISNNWNGRVPGGSGETWHYKIAWIGPCGPDGTPTGDGGYCIWGQFKMLLSHGTLGNGHFWDAHAIPAGFGRQ